MMPNEQIIGNIKPYDNFRSASVRGSSFIYKKKKNLIKIILDTFF